MKSVNLVQKIYKYYIMKISIAFWWSNLGKCTKLFIKLESVSRLLYPHGLSFQLDNSRYLFKNIKNKKGKEGVSAIWYVSS